MAAEEEWGLVLMGVAYLPFPDVEAVMCTVLKEAGVAAGRIGSGIPPDPVFPLCVVQRLGGLPPEKRKLDAARIQVDTWGDSKEDAYDTAEAARLAVFNSEGQIYQEYSAMVTSVLPESALIWAPDPELGRPRYHFTVMAYAMST